MQLGDEALLLPQEAAKHLGVKLESLTDWRRDGGGPEYWTVGSRVFYPLSKLQAFVSKPPATETPTDGGEEDPSQDGEH